MALHIGDTDKTIIKDVMCANSKPKSSVKPKAKTIQNGYIELKKSFCVACL